LVGIKGNPRLNRNLDCDCIVSEVRETSRKPDEIYNLIERMFPNCMKLELFGRPHNVHENWITCGNQLDGVRFCDDELCKRYNVEYPDAKTEPYRRSREEVMPAAAAGESSSGKPGGVLSEDAPWIPPSSAPDPIQGPIPKAPVQPSSSEAWIPPSAPPPGQSVPPSEDRSASHPPPQGYPSGWGVPPHGYPPAWGPAAMGAYGAMGPYGHRR
jgi:mRNA (2'-O-methyladenosine-N6-)-methyltransferase